MLNDILFYEESVPLSLSFLPDIIKDVKPGLSGWKIKPVCTALQWAIVFQEFNVNITEDFIEYLSDGALAIEVYGHKMNDPRKNPALWDLGIIQAKTRSLRDRWVFDIHWIPISSF